jgi:hypothetical protein
MAAKVDVTVMGALAGLQVTVAQFIRRVLLQSPHLQLAAARPVPVAMVVMVVVDLLLRSPMVVMVVAVGMVAQSMQRVLLRSPLLPSATARLERVAMPGKETVLAITASLAPAGAAVRCSRRMLLRLLPPH